MIDLIISATVGGFIGFFTCAVMTVGNTSDMQARIDRALSCETPKAAHGVKKMAAILRGDA